MKGSKGKGPASGATKVAKKPFPLVNRQTSQPSTPKDPVEVYCRVRPLKENELESCVSVPEDTVLQITPPECSLAFKNGHKNPNQHKFKYVFSETSDQRRVFDSLGLPLVEDLLQGKNGLLFAYGITNSGKTYTMNGEPDQAGILPRSLDIVFNSIADVQALKYVFRPDGVNRFDLFTEEEAIAEAHRNKPKKISSRIRSEMPEYGDLLRIAEPRKVGKTIDEDSSYSVFISYVEIYNNLVYDLLENKSLDNIKPSAPNSHNLREDTSRNMYVSGVTEVEVKSTEEAFEVLYRGQKMRRVANTQLNQESSRSHSVFTIKLVQAPLDHTGKEVLQDKSKVVFSQLSLVDLAGSERTSRTGSSGERLKEAGNINKDLMVLRTCMEILRENQTSNLSKYVPYRDSKLTHLFKNYFDGEGKVRMVVCISPHSEDYDESIQVMRFAEVTQEVVVARPETVKVKTGLAPGRKRAYMLYKAAMSEATSSRVADNGEEEPAPHVIHPYTLALGVISIQKYISEYCTVDDFSEFKERLEKRSLIRQQLVEDFHKKQLSFKEDLMELESEADILRTSAKEHKSVIKVRDKLIKENHDLRTLVATQDDQMAQLTAKLEQANSNQASLVKQNKCLKEQLALANQQTEMLAKTTELYEADKRELENELVVERKQLEKNKKQADQLRQTMDGRVRLQKEKFDKLAKEMKEKQNKLKQVEEVIKNSPLVSTRSTLKDSNHPNIRTPSTTSLRTPSSVKKSTNIPALRTRGRKRSLSENWLEHKPQTTVKSGDILQPSMKKKKTVSTPKPRDFRSKQVDKYCLQHQEEDSQGEVKTALFKGEIQRTRGGGTAVKFTDVEVLKHSRPKTPATVTKAPRRSARLTRQPSDLSHSASSLSSVTGSECSLEGSVNDWTDVETRCAVAIEGRPGNSSPAFTHTLADRPGQI